MSRFNICEVRDFPNKPVSESAAHGDLASPFTVTHAQQLLRSSAGRAETKPPHPWLGFIDLYTSSSSVDANSQNQFKFEETAKIIKSNSSLAPP